MAPDLARLDSGRGHAGLGGGYRAEAPGLSCVRLNRESEALETFALREKDNCAFAFVFPLCTTVRICRTCQQAREATSLPLS